MKEIRTNFPVNKLALSFVVLMVLGCSLARAEGDYKKYVPQEFRQYVPDAPGNDSDGPGDKVGNGSNNATLNSYGPHRYVDQKFDNLTIYGPVTVKKVTIAQNAQIYGPLSGSNLRVKELKVQGPMTLTELEAETANVNGPVDLRNSKLTGDIIINGPLEAHSSIFNETIDIATNELTLNDTAATTLAIRKNSEYPSKVQKVFLNGRTIVKDISFESNNGEVIISKPAQVKGDVKGGKIILQD